MSHMAPKRSVSRSDVQRRVEIKAIEEAGLRLGVRLQPKKLKLEQEQCAVEIDGYHESEADGRIILVECWARIGKAKSAQVKKVSTDVLKLAFVSSSIEEARPGFKVDKYVVFIDQEAASVLLGKSWNASVAKKLGVRTLVLDLGQEIRGEVTEAQIRQGWTNGS